MAVVFISPKQRQRMFFVGITVVFLLFLVVVSFGVFLVKPQIAPSVLVFNKPKVDINMSVFDSDQFKNLQLLPEMETQYSYKAITSNNVVKTGFVTATSLDQARTILQGMGLNVTELKEVDIGRADPFIPYYTVVNQTPSTAKK